MGVKAGFSPHSQNHVSVNSGKTVKASNAPEFYGEQNQVSREAQK